MNTSTVPPNTTNSEIANSELKINADSDISFKKYLYLLKAFIRASFIADLEFRFNFILKILIDTLWYGAQVFTFEVLYIHTPTIGHWSLAQTRVFLGVLFTVDAIYMIFLHDNLDQFTNKVVKGDLDLLLVKPVPSQFMISFQKIALAHIGNFVIAASWLIWSFTRLPEVSWIKFLWLVVMIPNGVLIYYSFRFIFASTAVILVRSENLQFLWYNFIKLGYRPDSIYFPWLKFIILSVIPVGVIASVPARTILDPPNFGLIAWALFLGPFSIYLSTKYWKYALKHYTSASS